MIAVRSSKPIEFESNVSPQEPVVIFDLSGLGLHTSSFLDWLLPTFQDLKWDYYDVRREQINLLRRLYSLAGATWEPYFLDYYRGSLSLEQVMSALGPAPISLHESALVVEPYRMRSTARVTVARFGDGWVVERLPKAAISQNVASTDYRSITRSFDEIPDELLLHQNFHNLFCRIADLVREASAQVQALEVTCWQTAISTSKLRAGSNSPEGIHQDGADYIVSALVLERDNIHGGESRIWAADKTTKILSVTLQPGQGLFQADTGSSLWHDVTPITVLDPNKTGTRKILGFDIRVLH